MALLKKIILSCRSAATDSSLMQTVKDYHRQQGDDCEAESVTATAVLGDLGAPSVSPVHTEYYPFNSQSPTSMYATVGSSFYLLLIYPGLNTGFSFGRLKGATVPFDGSYAMYHQSKRINPKNLC